MMQHKPVHNNATQPTSFELGHSGIARDYYPRPGMGGSYMNPGEQITRIMDLAPSAIADAQKIKIELAKRGIAMTSARVTDRTYRLSGQRQAIDQVANDLRFTIRPES